MLALARLAPTMPAAQAPPLAARTSPVTSPFLPHPLSLRGVASARPPAEPLAVVEDPTHEDAQEDADDHSSDATAGRTFGCFDSHDLDPYLRRAHRLDLDTEGGGGGRWVAGHLAELAGERR